MIHPLIHTPEIQVILLDCSESMRPFEEVVIATFNRSLAGLQRSKRAYRTFLAVIGFGTSMTPLVGFSPLARVLPMRQLPYSNGTCLNETAHNVLVASIALCDALWYEGRSPRFTISVMTDGHDNMSHPKYERRVRELAADAHERSFDLRLYAFGVNASSLAEILGFPPKRSRQLIASTFAVSWTLDRILRV